ncbi:MAG: PAS domain S-box protein [Acidobacteria bacterium]|nr:PAS domain S-box protein [Acidobacteriota bacterium]
MAVLLAIVFVTEAGIMVVLPMLGSTRLSRAVAAGVDASLLVVVLAPILWWWLIKPLQSGAASDQQRATRLAAILEATPDLVSIADPDGRLVYLNRAGRQMLGIGELADLRSYDIPDFLDAANAHRVLSVGIPTAIREGSWSGETELVPLAGQPITVSQVILAHTAPDGTVAYLSTIARDITENKKTERALNRSRDLLADTGRIARIGGWELNLETQALDWNAEVYRIHEVDPAVRPSVAEAIQFYAPEARPIITAAVQAAIDAGTPFDLELPLVTAKGRRIWVRALGTAERREGKTIRLYGAFQDITERRMADHLRRLQSAALNAAAEAVVITDRAGTIEWVNPAFATLTGYTAQEAFGKNPRDLVRSGKHDRGFYEGLWQTILAGGVWRGEMINRRKDGSLYTEEQSVTPIPDASGTITHFVAMKRDLTEHRQLEAQFRQAQKMESVGQLAAGIAHDFNNLLTVVNGMSDLVLSNLGADDPVGSDVREIRSAGMRAATLTQQLLAFSRRQILESRVINLDMVVQGMESMLQRLLGDDIDLAVVPTADVGSVKADPGQIEQVITNLAVNAKDAMAQGGQLTIETQNVTLDEGYGREHGVEVTPGPYVLLAVSDTGVGMDEATRARIFEPFFTTKAPGEGTGLGLSTVYGIVKQSQGFIWVYSEVGRGTTFKIYLPQVAQPTDTARPEPSLAPGPGTETILLVEDNAALRQVATRFLEPAGYTVLAAASGEDALRLLERYDKPVQLLLSDVVMPGMSGRSLAEQLALTHPAMKVLYMSGYAADAVLRHGVLDVAAPFLAKPFTEVVLLRKVREVLGSQASGPAQRQP